jgi:hypothetical protein
MLSWRRCCSCAPRRARDALMQLFGVGGGAGSSRRRYSTIIVLDEIDMLMTKDQAVSISKQPAAVPATARSS